MQIGRRGGAANPAHGGAAEQTARERSAGRTDRCQPLGHTETLLLAAGVGRQADITGGYSHG